MRQAPNPFKLSGCALAASILVSACGGGASPPNAVPGSSGFAIDDYLSGATVLCDSNGNGSAEVGEVTVATDSSGFFKFSTACTATIVVTGGKNIDTGLDFTGKLKAPAGSTIVTPLTTLLVEGMTIDQVNMAFGLPPGTDVKSLDPARKTDGALVNADLFKKTLALQQMLQKTTEVFASLATAGGDAARPAIYGEVAAAMAAALRANPTLISGNTLDLGAVTALIKAAALRVGTSTILSSEIKNGVLALNADSLAQVVAGGLKAQAEAILAAADANLTVLVKTAQMSSLITDFVLTNKAQLGGAPSGNTAGLATTLTTDVQASMVGGVTPTPTPAPTPTGTVLVSFDETVPAFLNMGAYGDALPSVVAAPVGGSGNVLKILKPTSQVTFGGVYFGVAAIPFAADRQVIAARVRASRAGAIIKFKVESSNGGPAIEVASAPMGAANTWQTVTWSLAGVDVSKSYTTIAITPDADLATTGQSYHVDDIALLPAVVVPPPVSCATANLQCISFSESTIALESFGGMLSAAVVNDPVLGASNKVAKLVKGPTSEVWAGTTIYTAGMLNPNPAVHSALSIDTVGLTTSKIVTLRVFTGAAIGTKITLKLENAIDPGVNIAAETVTTVQNAWETLTFNFANLTTGVFSSSATYNTASVFPAFSIPGPNGPALTTNTEFFFDELKYAVFVAPTPTPTPTPSPTPTTLTFDEPTPPAFVGFDGGEGTSIATGPSGGSGNAFKILRSGGQIWAGAKVTGLSIPLAANKTTITALVYSPTAGIPFVLKLEGPGASAEVQASAPVVQGWQTLSWTFSGSDLKTWTDLVFLPNLGTTGTGEAYFVDNVVLGAAAASPTPTPAPTPTPTPTPSPVGITFDEATPPAFVGFDGGEATTIAAGPSGGSGNAFKILRSGGQIWAGAKVSGLSIPLSANKTTITARVNSPTAGIPFVLKLEGPGASAEVQASTPVVQGWQTLSWTFSGGDLKTWTDLVFLPNLGTVGTGEAYFVDDVTGVSLPAPVNSAAEMGSGGPQTLTLSTGDNKGIFTAGEAIFAFDYKGGLDQLNNYASYTGGRSDGTPGNGNIGFFQDAALSNSAQKLDEGGWIAGTSLDPGGTPNFFRYFVLKAPAFTTSYMGLYANAPNNGTVNVSTFANIKFRLWGPAEMYQLNNLNPVVEITLTGPKVSGCGTGSGGTEISKNLTANQKIGAGSVYKMALATGWTVKGLCGTDTNQNAQANVLATLARVIVTVPGTSFNFTNSNANSNPVSFSTGVNLGPIGFTNN